jgi:hypothetical protein
MNKTEIVEIVDMFEMSAEASKSCVNRLESALTKTGSTSSRLSMASSSLSALRDKYEVESSDYASLNALSSILKFTSVLGVDNKKPAQAEAKPAKKRKTGWENLKDADATPRKPKKSEKSEALVHLEDYFAKEDAKEQIEILLGVLNSMGR